MRELDETDIEILSLLAEDARRPFKRIGDEVGLSGPAVSDRIDRLLEAGIVERFTIEVDRSHLRAGVPVFVRFQNAASQLDPLREALHGADGVEHVFVTAEGHLWLFGHAEGTNVRRWIQSLLPEEIQPPFTVALVDEAEWTPSFEGTTFAIRCAECGNTVDAEGETSRIDGSVHHFCCASCRDRFEDTYHRFASEA